MFWYSIETYLARSGWVTILYSEDMSEILYTEYRFTPVDKITRCNH